MGSYFDLTLDTTAPSSPSIIIEGGATYATQQLVNTTINTPSSDAYQMKIWGSVDPSHNTSIQATEGTSQWITYTTSQQVKLSATDGLKTLYLKIRDDVYNESAQASDTITLDTTLPVVSVTATAGQKIGLVSGKDTFSFSFTCDTIFDQYKVMIVTNTSDANDAGTNNQIGTANGSVNMSGVAGSYPANTVITCTIKGLDYQAARAGDAVKHVKVFCKDQSGQWSV